LKRDNAIPTFATSDILTSPWLNTKQAAAYLGIDQSELRCLARAGKIGYSRPSERRYRFHMRELDDYLVRSAVPAIGPTAARVA